MAVEPQSHDGCLDRGRRAGEIPTAATNAAEQVGKHRQEYSDQFGSQRALADIPQIVEERFFIPASWTIFSSCGISLREFSIGSESLCP